MYVNRRYSCVRQPEPRKSSSVWHWSRWPPELSATFVGISFALVSLITFTLSCFLWSCRWLFSSLTWLSCVKFVVERPATPPTILDFNINSQPRRHHHHHQSTSSNSTVPTVMLVTTSLIYVLLNGAWSISYLVLWYTGAFYEHHAIAAALSRFIYAYNFYVYLITGKQFRADLLTLVCCCCRSSSSAAAAANVTVARRDQAETVLWNFMEVIWILKHITFIGERHHQNSITSSLKHRTTRHVSKLQITEFDD